MNYLGNNLNQKPIYRLNTAANFIAENAVTIGGIYTIANGLSNNIIIIDWFRIQFSKDATVSVAGLQQYRFNFLSGINFLHHYIWLPAVFAAGDSFENIDTFINIPNGFYTQNSQPTPGESLRFLVQNSLASGVVNLIVGFHYEKPR